MKLAPAIKQAMKQAQEALSKVDMKEFNKKVQQSAILVKKQIRDMKKSSKNNEMKIHINNKEAKEKINQIKKQMDSLKKQTTARYKPK